MYIYFTKDGEFSANELPEDVELHRDSGPALIRTVNDKVVSEKWYKNNVLHRADGPAVSFFNHQCITRRAYFFNGKHYLDIKKWEAEVLRQTFELI